MIDSSQTSASAWAMGFVKKEETDTVSNAKEIVPLQGQPWFAISPRPSFLFFLSFFPLFFFFIKICALSKSALSLVGDSDEKTVPCGQDFWLGSESRLKSRNETLSFPRVSGLIESERDVDALPTPSLGNCFYPIHSLVEMLVAGSHILLLHTVPTNMQLWRQHLCY